MWPFWLGLELVAILLTLIVFVLVSPFVQALVGGAGGGRPVLLVHGYGMSRGSKLVLAWRLARAGVGPIRFAAYWSFAPLDRSAARIANAARALADATGVPRVDVVAHSMGGIVTRTARLQGAPIGRVITLGTPHRGVFWRYLPVLGPMTRAMQPGTVGPCEPGDLAICGRLDFIIPWRYATLDAPGDTHILDSVGHAGLLVDRRVADRVIAHLAAADREAPVAAAA